MDIRYVQSFVAVVEGGSLAAAARKLDLTAAAVAARVRSLEEDLGAALIQRSGRSVRPTAQGIKVLESAHVLLRSARDMQALARDGQAEVGELRLGVFSSAMTNVLPSLLQGFYRSYPHASLYVEPGASVELCSQVAAGELDAAVVVEPQFAIPKTCEWIVLMEEPLVVIAPAGVTGRDAHALLRNEPFIRYNRHVLGGQLADRYLRDHDIVPHQRLEIDSLLAIAAMVGKGLGVSLLPDWSQLWEGGQSLVKIELPDRPPVRRVGLIVASQSPRVALARMFAEQALLAFGNNAGAATAVERAG
ncbi:LysR family transcriptional regulator [Herbaspirillum sp. LeCh32-8]|uniref:LysR family transcriptional regulator n=1 Tax=Herbaspirillum sp. LeCh32-8 TaxID=2821356 RepID=UPI001AE7F8E2|nr:LysR family transcriptional regulator [Herbaspirillum sp. LeCh32-8]MBP0597698.1 LysR family transcriptional regulator [Herbaspirillum sp. LeCh32-8]